MNLVVVCWAILCSLFGASDHNQEWKEVEGKNFSFEVPASWVIQSERLPLERDTEIKGVPVHIYTTSWINEVLTVESISNITGLSIQSYEISDKTKLSMEELQSVLVSNIYRYPVLKVYEKTVSDGFEKHVFLRKDKGVSVTEGVVEKEYMHYHLFRCHGDVLYVLHIHTPYKKGLKKKDVERMLNSFKVKEMQGK